MTDIFQEVDEDLRREEINRLWKQYGPQAIGVFVVAVVLAAGFVGYTEYRKSQARAVSVKYQEVVQAGENVKPKAPAERIAALDKIDATLTPGYKLLSRFERAGALAEQGLPADAAKLLDAIAADDAVDENFRSTASVKAAQLLADTLTPQRHAHAPRQARGSRERLSLRRQ